MAAFKQRTNKFPLLFLFLLTLFLVYWYNNPQLVQQKWYELEGEVRKQIKGQTVVDEFLEKLREQLRKFRTEPTPSQSSNKIVY